MGRRKIAIKPIENDRVKSITLSRRTQGLVKKAHELAVLCECEVMFFMFDQKNGCHLYSSENPEQMMEKFQDYLLKVNSEPIHVSATLDDDENYEERPSSSTYPPSQQFSNQPQILQYNVDSRGGDGSENLTVKPQINKQISGSSNSSIYPLLHIQKSPQFMHDTSLKHRHYPDSGSNLNIGTDADHNNHQMEDSVFHSSSSHHHFNPTFVPPFYPVPLDFNTRFTSVDSSGNGGDNHQQHHQIGTFLPSISHMSHLEESINGTNLASHHGSTHRSLQLPMPPLELSLPFSGQPVELDMKSEESSYGGVMNMTTNGEKHGFENVQNGVGGGVGYGHVYPLPTPITPSSSSKNFTRKRADDSGTGNGDAYEDYDDCFKDVRKRKRGSEKKRMTDIKNQSD